MDQTMALAGVAVATLKNQALAAVVAVTALAQPALVPALLQRDLSYQLRVFQTVAPVQRQLVHRQRAECSVHGFVRRYQQASAYSRLIALALPVLASLALAVIHSER